MRILDYLCTLHTWGDIIHEETSYLGRHHTWGDIILGETSYLGRHHTWEDIIQQDMKSLRLKIEHTAD